MASRVDLHLHTKASDGALRPAELVQAAARIGIRAMAVTDHDSVNGIAEAREAACDLPIEVIPGIELSASLDRDEIHILGYLLDVDDPSLQKALRRLREDRLAQAQAMVERLGALGHPLQWDRVMAIANGGSVGRPHIAKALVECGAVTSVDEAFSRFLRRGGPGYVEGPKILPQEAVRLIREAHGVPSLAHPIIVGASDYHLNLDRLLPTMVEAGLAGIETYYKGYTQEITGSCVRLLSNIGWCLPAGAIFMVAGLLRMPSWEGWKYPGRVSSVFEPENTSQALYRWPFNNLWCV